MVTFNRSTIRNGTFGNLAKCVFSNGCATVYEYDCMNRLQSAVTTKGVTPASDFRYGYDLLGQKTQATEKFQLTTGLKTITTNWFYDNLNRVVEEAIVHYDTSLNRNTKWQYDVAGNRTKQIFGSTTTDYVYDANDRLTSEKVGATVTASYTYDGTQLTGKTASGTTTTYTYNLQGRMSQSKVGSAAAVAYQYDSDGVRVLQGTTKYLNDKLNPTGYSQVFIETNGSTKTAITCGLDVISQSTGGTVLTMLYDGRGSVRSLTNASGVIDGNGVYNYDAFGNAIGTPPTSTNYRFTGELLDASTGYYYLRARYYFYCINWP